MIRIVRKRVTKTSTSTFTTRLMFFLELSSCLEFIACERWSAGQEWGEVCGARVIVLKAIRVVCEMSPESKSHVGCRMT